VILVLEQTSSAPLSSNTGFSPMLAERLFSPRIAQNTAQTNHRIPECSGLEGTSVGHPAQPPAQAGSPTAGCTAPRPGGSSGGNQERSPGADPSLSHSAWVSCVCVWIAEKSTFLVRFATKLTRSTTVLFFLLLSHLVPMLLLCLTPGAYLLHGFFMCIIFQMVSLF